MAGSAKYGWVLLAVLVAVMAAAYFWDRRKRNQKQARKQLPKQWPLKTRLAAGAEECQAWNWLISIFPQHQVVLKLPVTRFTAAMDPTQGPHWYRMLNNVHCLFTVCTPNGRVIGCVDIEEDTPSSKRNRSLKQSLLLQCGVPYCTIRIGQRTGAESIRQLFLRSQVDLTGAPSITRSPESVSKSAVLAAPVVRTDTERERYKAEILEMRQKLSAAVATRRRLSRDSGFGDLTDSSGAPLTVGGEYSSSQFGISEFPSSEFMTSSFGNR